MTGKIVKGIAGFYYVHAPNDRVYECKAKGVFRNRRVKPLVGDNVEFTVIDEEKLLGNVIEILKRDNQLVRPAVANVDQAVIIFACAKPEPNFNLLDRFLIMMARQKVPCVICFNKEDLVSTKQMDALRAIYEVSGYQVVFTSTKEENGLDSLTNILKDKTTVLAGPSGVGKSSIMNRIKPEAQMETGEISKKIERGKHTTRHSELFHVSGETYLMDTPGFTSLSIEGMEKEELKDYFFEFEAHEPYCQFKGCVHINEPRCGVKDALEEGTISKIRYENYKLLYEELKQHKKY